MSDDKAKDPLEINDLPEGAEGAEGAEDVKGGMVRKITMSTSDSCNSNTLTCKDTSTSNTLCCT